MARRIWPAALAAVGIGTAAAGWLGVVSGAVAFDFGVGRRDRQLGPQVIDIDAPRAVVFDLITRPYLDRTAEPGPVILERGDDMVLAAHFTDVGRGLKTTTVETVRFTRPSRVDFRLVRGPVPTVVESIQLSEHGTGTRLLYAGTMSTDLWGLGVWWGRTVARRWGSTVAAHLASIRDRAERSKV